MDCYINHTGSFLPGPPLSNQELPHFLGTLEGEQATREKLLRMNGIKTRHYALTKQQDATHDLYQLATQAAQQCLSSCSSPDITYLSAGTTNAPLVAPGLGSILHDHLSQAGLLHQHVEINSNTGICTSSAQALVNAIRAIQSGEHRQALTIGVEQPSAILKSSFIQPPDDRDAHSDERNSKWFMSVFLRSMLSDGAGSFLLGSKPEPGLTSFKVNWSHSRSFADQTPLCMQLESRSLLLTQDVSILSRHMKPCVRQLLDGAFQTHGDTLDNYQYVLPHLSSFFFKRYLLSVLKKFSPQRSIPYWTNLETAGNTGAASIYLMLDQFKQAHNLKDGDKILLFIPESGQFNFVLLSLTVIKK